MGIINAYIDVDNAVDITTGDDYFVECQKLHGRTAVDMVDYPFDHGALVTPTAAIQHGGNPIIKGVWLKLGHEVEMP